MGFTRPIRIAATVVTLVASVVVSHYLLVFRTGLAVNGNPDSACDAMWGPTSCFSTGRPAVVLIVLGAGILAAAFIWRMTGSAHGHWLIGAVLMTLIAAAVAAVFILPPRCDGARYGLIEDDGNARRWGCFSTIK
jgi:hypothetical protein